MLFTASAAQEGEQVQSATIEHGELAVSFRDNSHSPQELSGVDALFNVKHAAGYDAFDPDTRGASAGLNFEHIISGHQNPNNKFAPRHGRYTLHKLPDRKSVLLMRRAEDCPWKVASTLLFCATGRRWSSQQAGTPLFLEAITLALDVERRRVVQQAVQNRRGQHVVA